MTIPATTLSELGLCELGLARLGFAPADSRPVYGVGPYGPRYAYVTDSDVALFKEETEVAALLNLVMDQGATWAHTWRIQNRDGTPVDLTGATALLQVRKTKSTAGIHVLSLATYSAPVGAPSPWRVDISMDAAAGKFSITTPPSATASLPAGDWYYDFKVTFLSGEVYRFAEGRFTIAAAVAA